MNQSSAPAVDGIDFRPCPDLADYRLGDDGSVWNQDRLGNWKSLTVSCHKNGPATPGFTVCTSGRQTRRILAPLMARAFHGEPKRKSVVKYRDGNVANVAASNLCWEDYVCKVYKRVKAQRKKNTIVHQIKPTSDRYCGNAEKLTRQDEIDLAARIRSGDEVAFCRLVEANMPMVTWAADRFKPKMFDLDDAIQEGMEGLMYAARRFDPTTHDAKFSTYAMYWIRQYIQRGAIKHMNVVRRPSHMHFLLCKIRKLENVGAMSCEQIAAAIDAPVKTVKILIESDRSTFSLSRSGDNDAWKELESHSTDGQLSKVEDRDEAEWLMRLMEKLSEQERFVLYRRFGFISTESAHVPGEPEWVAIGRDMGIEGYKARKIGWRAIRKLRVFAGRDGGEDGDTLDMLLSKKKRMVSGATPAPGASDAVPRDRASD